MGQHASCGCGEGGGQHTAAGGAASRHLGSGGVRALREASHLFEDLLCCSNCNQCPQQYAPCGVWGHWWLSLHFFVTRCPQLAPLPCRLQILACLCFLESHTESLPASAALLAVLQETLSHLVAFVWQQSAVAVAGCAGACSCVSVPLWSRCCHSLLLCCYFVVVLHRTAASHSS